MSKLRRKHNVLSASPEYLAQERFGFALCVVDVGCIEEIDSGIDRGVNNLARTRKIKSAAEIVAA
jgi:hypothetical protein